MANNFLYSFLFPFLTVPLHFSLLLFKYSFLLFPPTPPHPLALPASLPFPSPLVIVHMSFIIVPINPSPFSPIIPFPLPSDHCQPVLNFNVFGYTILCLLVHFVDKFPVNGEIIWYLSFTTWLISLSIMLSSSTHAVLKGRSFFLSAAYYSIV